jgi:hypothetical protein
VDAVRANVSSNDLIRVDRRRYPRLHLVGALDGLVVPFQLGVRVVDISAGGLSVQSPFDFPRGTTHEFQFAILEQPRPVFRAVAVHSERMTPRPGRALFVAGFEFRDLSSAARETIDAIVAGVDWTRSSTPPVIVPAAELPTLDAFIKYK